MLDWGRFLQGLCSMKLPHIFRIWIVSGQRYKNGHQASRYSVDAEETNRNSVEEPRNPKHLQYRDIRENHLPIKTPLISTRSS